MSSPPTPSNCTTSGGFLGSINCGAGAALNSNNESINALLAAIAGSIGSFGGQLLVFLLLRLRLSRIYRPRSYLVPEKDRVPAPPRGIVAWLKPLFATPNLAFIQKCGLDAYFFLRYLRMLLKIFLPLALIILPILLPLNRYSGSSDNEEQGLNRLAISNVSRRFTRTRLWAHLILAVGVIIWVCYVAYRELRGYIRVRQAYLTSPQHRIKASATTVLVTGIPPKWLTLEALNGLYDVFPGGIRNIWINRNFDELADKVSYRDSLARGLEDAETNLIKTCCQKHEKLEKRRRKQDGESGRTKEQRKGDRAAADAAAEIMAQGQGVSAGDQHEVPHNLQEAVIEAEEEEEEGRTRGTGLKGFANPLGLMGHGIGAVGKGIGNVGKGAANFGQKIAGDVDTGLHKAYEGVDRRVDAADRGKDFVTDDSLYRNSSVTNPPTPPSKSPTIQQQARMASGSTDGAGDGVLPDSPMDRRKPAAHPMAANIPVAGTSPSPASESTQVAPSVRMTGPSLESAKPPRSPMQIEEPAHLSLPRKTMGWQIWRNNDRSIALPSPQPHTAEEDEFPLNANAVRANASRDSKENSKQEVSGSKWTEKLQFWKKKGDEGDEKAQQEYPKAYNSEWDEDQDEEPYWRRYIEPSERETMRVPIFSPTWCPSLPLIGKKVDRIYWIRRELARMNLEIEADQADVDKFPFMNSAFIQFNHQVAAHMACQSVSHHVPQHMAPRIVEISPDDVLWDNMSIKWWERYIRTGIVLAVCAGLIILYAVPVTFTSLLSNVSQLAQVYPWLSWLNDLPKAAVAIIEGILPPLLLTLILLLVPLIFRLLVKQQGVPTGNAKELGVQQWYFSFLFIQVFLVVTIAGGLIQTFTEFAANPTHIVDTLAQNLPKAGNYFFSYLMIQALSNSASALLQTGALVSWFVLAWLLDSTPRAKWRRQTTLSSVQWGSFYPPFTNYAVIGIIYSVIAPLILVFMLIIFSLFWIVWRYNVLYVYQFRNDTGGLLFPVAVNQLFTGLYVMELCLIGFFFISMDEAGKLVCIPEAIIMIVALVATAAYQFLLNTSFDPLLRYLPITLEDEAVIRDEQFARAQASKFAPLRSEEIIEDTRDIQDVLEERERDDELADDKAAGAEKRDIEEHRRSHRDSSTLHTHPSHEKSAPRASTDGPQSPRPWHLRNPASPTSPTSTWHSDRRRETPAQAVRGLKRIGKREPSATNDAQKESARMSSVKAQPDVEAQHTVGDVLFSGFADELEDLTPEERDVLVRYAFQHSAMRAKRPVVWIPRDKLGVSDDEIKRAKKMSTVVIDDPEKNGSGEVEKTTIWMSNEGTALNGQGKVVFGRSPPDFSNVDLIVL